MAQPPQKRARNIDPADRSAHCVHATRRGRRRQGMRRGRRRMRHLSGGARIESSGLRGDRAGRRDGSSRSGGCARGKNDDCRLLVVGCWMEREPAVNPMSDREQPTTNNQQPTTVFLRVGVYVVLYILAARVSAPALHWVGGYLLGITLSQFVAALAANWIALR